MIPNFIGMSRERIQTQQKELEEKFEFSAKKLNPKINKSNYLEIGSNHQIGRAHLQFKGNTTNSQNQTNSHGNSNRRIQISMKALNIHRSDAILCPPTLDQSKERPSPSSMEFPRRGERKHGEAAEKRK